MNNLTFAVFRNYSITLTIFEMPARDKVRAFSNRSLSSVIIHHTVSVILTLLLILLLLFPLSWMPLSPPDMLS